MKINSIKKVLKIEYKFKMKRIHLILSVTLLLAASMCATLHLNGNVNYALWLIPLSFAIMFTISAGGLSIIKNPCLCVLFVTMLLRYIILPLSIYINGEKYFDGYNMNAAVLILLLEMLFVNVTIIICSRLNFFKRYNKVGDFHNEYRINKGIVVIVILASLIILFMNPSLLGSKDVLMGDINKDVLKAQSGISGISSIIWNVGRAFIYLFMLNKTINTYRRTQKMSYAIIAIILSLLFVVLIFISGVRINRWGMTIALLSCIYLLLTTFTKQRKIIFVFAFIPLIALLLLATFYKNMAGNLNVGISATNYIDNLLKPEFLDSYLGGVKNVSYSIKMKDYFGTSIYQFFNDCMNNFPYFNKFYDRTNTTIFLFNRAVYGMLPANDQIIPIIGQGFSYFGWIFSPVLSVLATILMFYFNMLARVATNIFKKYIYIHTGFFLSVFMCLNMTILLSDFYSTVIPFVLLISLNDIGWNHKIIIYNESSLQKI